MLTKIKISYSDYEYFSMEDVHFLASLQESVSYESQETSSAQPYQFEMAHWDRAHKSAHNISNK